MGEHESVEVTITFRAMDQTNNFIRETLSMDSDDLYQQRTAHVNLECVRVEGSGCQSNVDYCPCDLGLVTSGHADLFGAFSECDSVILRKEGDIVVISIGNI